MVSDGDSKAHTRLLKMQPYGPNNKDESSKEIEKEDCINHVEKRLGAALRNLVADCSKKGITLGGRGHGRLTAETIRKLQIYYSRAIRGGKTAEEMRRNVLASIYHGYSTDDLPRKSRTVLIHKKGETDDPGNFRPISLLNALYKLYSGILASRITRTATPHNWLSAEQKGFLPGVRGIHEHTFLLQTAIDEAKKHRGDLSVAWLDLTNAFGSIPHPVLIELFRSLPIPEALRHKLADIYTDNQWDFVCGQETVQAQPVTEVRQGDRLSPIIFNLASEPLVRAAK